MQQLARHTVCSAWNMDVNASAEIPSTLEASWPMRVTAVSPALATKLNPAEVAIDWTCTKSPLMSPPELRLILVLQPHLSRLPLLVNLQPRAATPRRQAAERSPASPMSTIV